jgi:pimeloyl-ACP methyl ester carboxylesterase
MMRVSGRTLCLAALFPLVAISAPVFAQGNQPPTLEAATPAVPREVLERYVGRYALNGTIVTVAVTEDDRLTVQLTGQPVSAPLRTVSANEFVGDEAGVRLFFEGEGPKATRIRSQYAGSEVAGMRIPDGGGPEQGQLAQLPPPPVDEALVPYASAADAVRLPDGRLLNFVCMGQGSPTVVLTAGMGNLGGPAWVSVQAAMAKTTRVCAWDRPGWGLSDGSPMKQTVATTTADLEAALATGSIAGPYVMVGHSLGAFESLLFTDRHQDQVVGMVLVDPSVPDQQALMQRVGLPTPDTGSNPALQAIRKCAADIRSGTARPDAPVPGNCFTYPPSFPPALANALAQKVSNPIQYETMASFLMSGEEDFKIAINPSRNYGDMPLIVLTAIVDLPLPPNAPPEIASSMRALAIEWNKAHDELAALSTRGVNARVPGANHDMQGSRPQVVIDAVEAVVAEARAGRR